MITVFGSVGLDMTGTVPRLPGPGETVLGGTFSTAPGNKGANQALAARRAGAPVRHVGAIGEDAYGREAITLLTEGGVDLSGLQRLNTITSIAMIFVDAKGENAIAVLPGANAALTPADADRALADMRAGDILLLQQEITQAATDRALLRHCRVCDLGIELMQSEFLRAPVHRNHVHVHELAQSQARIEVGRN